MERRYDEDLLQSAGTKIRLVDRVVEEIMGLISSGKLAPGTRLLPEREFAERLGVSRPVVREAMHQLVAKGLLESKHGSGTVVRQVTRDAFVEPLGWLLQAEGATLEHLHHVRSILEVDILRLAARQATVADIEELHGIIHDMQLNRDNVEKFVSLDADFHRALADTTRNPLLAVLLDSVRDLMQEVRLEVHRYPVVYDTVVPDHEAIVAAVAARDPVAASTAMQIHLDHSHEFQREFIAAREFITSEDLVQAGASGERLPSKR